MAIGARRLVTAIGAGRLFTDRVGHLEPLEVARRECIILVEEVMRQAAVQEPVDVHVLLDEVVCPLVVFSDGLALHLGQLLLCLPIPPPVVPRVRVSDQAHASHLVAVEDVGQATLLGEGPAHRLAGCIRVDAASFEVGRLVAIGAPRRSVMGGILGAVLVADEVCKSALAVRGERRRVLVAE